VKIGDVHEDPRGKVNQGGSREHIFTVWTSAHSLKVMRFPNREAAEKAREQLAGRARS